MKKLKILLLILILTAGCQTAKKQDGSKKISLNLQEGMPPSFNPYVGVDLRSRCLYLALFEPLMRNKVEGGLELAAASSVEVDESQTLYTFHIRDAVWSNGEKVSSHHFKNAWLYALSPQSLCVRADLFYVIKNGEKAKKGEVFLEDVGIFTPDPKTLQVKLERPTPYFLELVATSFFLPLYEDAPEEPLSFNGPFYLKEKVADQKIVLKKNQSYWDKKAVDLEEICFTIVKDPMTAYVMFENGELDLVGDPFSPLPLDLISHLSQSGKLESQVISRIFHLLVNTSSFPLNSTALRNALSLSIDRDLLVEHIFFKEIPSFSPIPKPLSNVEFIKTKSPQEFLEEAVKELGFIPKLTFSYAELSGQKRLAEFLQNTWREKLGIEVEIEGLPWNAHIAKLRSRDYQIGTLHLTTIYQDPMFFLELYKDKASLCNYTAWEDPGFQKQLIGANLERDFPRRSELLAEAEKMLVSEMPAIPLFTQNLQYVKSDRLDLKILGIGVYDFKHTKLKEAQCL